MAFQPETATYDAGVYQLETTDQARGGLGGALNSPLLNLANRTAYLKGQVDSLGTTKANLSGAIFTDTVAVAPASGALATIRATATGAADATVDLDAPSGRNRFYRYRVGGVTRWSTFMSSGGDFGVQRYDASGNPINNPLTINLADGVVSLTNGLSVTGNATATGQVNAGGSFLSASPGSGVYVNSYWTVPGPVYGCTLASSNPNGGLCEVQGVHVPGSWIGLRLFARDNWFDFRNDGQAYKPGGGSWGDISDERLKIMRRRYALGLDVARRLQPWVFSFRPETGRDPEREHVSASAQNVEAAGAGHMVTSGRQILGSIDLPDAKTLDQSAVPWIAINSVQELADMVEALTARVAALEAANGESA